MAQVIIVSNRLPVSVSKSDGRLVFAPSVGGVATGLSSYVKNKRSTWVGWPGIASDDLSEDEKQQIVRELKKHKCVPVFLNKRQVDEFYNGYSNSVVWPLLHNLPVPERANGEKLWRTYREVNHMFAQAVATLGGGGSTVWVHDYQLMLLPEMLRIEHPSDNIGFFLHIPFPEPDVFQKLPEARSVVRGMLGADLLGFHTKGYVSKFLDTCNALNIGVAEEGQVVVGGRTVRVTDFPMGIDYEKYARAGRSRAVRAAIRKYRRRYGRRRVIVAVDRLDPTKGLLERLKAYREFLRTHPGLRGKVVMAMVAAPSRTEIQAYKELRGRLERLVREINNAFGTPRWQPVDFMNVSLPFEDISALYQIADVAFIAPLRDGMNLVAKEYVASKSNKEGVLILSETAGAAQELTEALLVDPAKPASLVHALEQALTMPKRELRRRAGAMQQSLKRRTVQDWARGFVKSLNQPLPGTPIITRSLTPAHRRSLTAAYRGSRHRLLLLDYDGVLSPFFNKPQRARPTHNLIRLLAKLSDQPNTEVILVSGRSREDLQDWFGDLNVSLAAEHGLVMRRAGKGWQTSVPHSNDWRRAVKPILQDYAAKTPGAFVETKGNSLVWHYRGASPYHAQKNLVILKRLLRPMAQDHKFTVENGDKILEVRSIYANKGLAVERWLKPQHDFALAIGDDYTDEDMFAALPDWAYTVKVGRGMTRARFRLGSVDDVLELLRRLARS